MKVLKFNYLIFSYLLFFCFTSCSESKDNKHAPIDEIGILNLEFEAFATLQRQNNDNLMVNERNLLELQFDSLGQCYYKNNPISLIEMKNLIHKYLTIQIDSIIYPKLITKSFKYAGSVKYPEMFYLLLRFDSALPYKKYIEIRSFVQIEYMIVRNDFSQNKFKKSIYQLIHSNDPADQERWWEIRQIFPIHYLEDIKR